jgi:hypothetical protein
MKKSIYDVYVTVTSQEQADRLKAICLEYGLPIWNDEDAFIFGLEKIYFKSYIQSKDFAVSVFKDDKTPITESDFIQLAKKFKQ